MKIVEIVIAILAIVRAWLNRSQSAADRQAGADAANADTLRRNAERVAEGRRAEADPDKDEDDGFRRD